MLATAKYIYTELDAALHSVQDLVLTQLVAGLAGDVGAAVVDAVLRLPRAGEMEAELVVWLLWEGFSQVTTGAVLSGKGGGTLIILQDSFERSVVSER